MTKRLFFAGLSFMLLTPVIPVFSQETPTGPVIGRGMPSGRSAKMAARLKYAPPNNYLKHYLGDDRYKVAGGVWKVVSTQLDTYYHRPTCPNILRQHADIVIGFAHSKDAEEAGYRADTVCQPKEESVVFGQTPGLTTDYLARALPLKLADGSTSVTLPAQWKRTASRSMDIMGMKMSMDSFKRKNSAGEVGIIVFPVPGGGSGELLLQQRMEQQGHQSGNQAFLEGLTATNPQMRGFTDSVAKPRKFRLNGTNAYAITIPKTSVRQGNRMVSRPGGNLTLVGKGTKIYMIIDTDKSKSARSLVSSFR